MKGYPGSDGGSDHVPIVVTLRLKLRKLHTKKSANKLQIQLLSTDAYINHYKPCINPELNHIDTIDQLEDRYDKFCDILSTSAQTTAKEGCQSQAEIDDIRHLAEAGKTKAGELV